MKKTFQIDWDNLAEVRALFNQSKSRFFELNRIADGRPSKKQRERDLLDACQTIWASDISTLYPERAGGGVSEYYVYAHLDTSKKIAIGKSGMTSFAATLGMSYFPFYIGKGLAGRCFELNRNETHRKVREKIAKLGKEVAILKIKTGLTESEALQAESKLIDIFGLLPHGGFLTNLDEGIKSAERRSFYSTEYQILRRINVPLTSTHVEGFTSTGKTRVVPATSTTHSY